MFGRPILATSAPYHQELAYTLLPFLDIETIVPDHERTSAKSPSYASHPTLNQQQNPTSRYVACWAMAAALLVGADV